MKRRYVFSVFGALLTGGCTGTWSNGEPDTTRPKETTTRKETTRTASAGDETSGNTSSTTSKSYTTNGPTQLTDSIRKVERSGEVVTVYLTEYDMMDYAEIDVLPITSSTDEPLVLTDAQIRQNPPLQDGLAFYRSELDEIEVNASYEAGQQVKQNLESYWEAHGRDTDVLLRKRVYEFESVRFSVDFKFYG